MLFGLGLQGRAGLVLELRLELSSTAPRVLQRALATAATATPASSVSCEREVLAKSRLQGLQSLKSSRIFHLIVPMCGATLNPIQQHPNLQLQLLREDFPTGKKTTHPSWPQTET